MERIIEWLTRRMSKPSSRRSFLDKTATAMAALAASVVGVAEARASKKAATKKKTPKKKPKPKIKKRLIRCCEYECDSGPRGSATVTICRHGSCPSELDRIARCETCYSAGSTITANCGECGNSIVSSCAGKTVKKKATKKA